MSSRADLIVLPQSVGAEHEALGHEVISDLHDAVERAFVQSRLSSHPEARVVLKKYIVGLLASVIAAPDNIAHAEVSAERAADMLVELVREMLDVYEGGHGV